MERLRFKFDEQKAAQAVAFLLRRAGERGLTKGYLVKMLYVADCRQLKRVGSPITGDQPTAMENGPVLSDILNRFNGKTQSDFWSQHFSTADGAHKIRVLKELPFDRLSEAEKKSLSLAYDQLKNYSWPALVHHLHQRKEWVENNPGRSSKPIPFESILEAEGRDEEFINELKSQQAENKLLSELFA